jgi:2-keto-4-pentenoate hydratase/2-oxohepta-3-ene-1,7-dioic acid hydratase in catechol pathway
VIATGTPSGVAAGMNPPPWLRPGQTVRLGIDELGEQSHRTVPAK